MKKWLIRKCNIATTCHMNYNWSTESWSCSFCAILSSSFTIPYHFQHFTCENRPWHLTQGKMSLNYNLTCGTLHVVKSKTFKLTVTFCCFFWISICLWEQASIRSLNSCLFASSSAWTLSTSTSFLSNRVLCNVLIPVSMSRSPVSLTTGNAVMSSSSSL